MLNGVPGIRADWLHDILVATPAITIASTVGASATSLQLNIRQRAQQVVPLTLEVSNEGGALAALSDIPFEVVMSQTGEITLSSERQRTPSRFLMDFESYQGLILTLRARRHRLRSRPEL
jgi:hypothetical protein